MNGTPLFKSEVTSKGEVRITVFRRNGKPTSVDVAAEAIPLFACKMLQDAQTASGKPEPQAPLAGSPVLNPAGLGLSGPDPKFPTALTVHMGKARFGIAIAKPRELGQALLAASASPDSSN